MFLPAEPITGSSPRVRGTPGSSCLAVGASRFIPACAGNSGTAKPATELPPVHPRVCGELASYAHRLAGLSGSSPRVRGTPEGARRFERRHRFIPACAGNSVAPRAPRRARPVHPRVCGELAKQVRERGLQPGSSPRVRGTRSLVTADSLPTAVHPRVCGELGKAVDAFGVGGRFIPACAGNSAWPDSEAAAETVHPRVCGELLTCWPALGVGFGSSPRVRGTRRPAAPPRRPPPVHPRVCGELVSWAAASASAAGSSPRVRGTRTSPRPSRPASTVHPRVCGELPRFGRRPGVSLGSSPRVRGTRVAGARRHRPRRFIPACAGNSRNAARWMALATVHPRVCGELGNVYYQSYAQDGSSPRVRGTPDTLCWALAGGRFIPACAGNSAGGTRARAATAVHPRVCGELAVRRRFEAGTERFIPACAGNSRRLSAICCTAPVHPRVCGELKKAGSPYLIRDGSSPRVRGTPQRREHVVRRRRFIPACAGNSSCPSVSRTFRSVHPRVCGELPARRLGAGAVPGSSPRVRGTPAVERREAHIARFIPACAGNSSP